MTDQPINSPATTLFSRLDPERQQFIYRAVDNAEMTIPYLLREIGDTYSTELELPWESTGGFLLNNLTNKIARSLFPQGIPWIKLKPNRTVLESFNELEDDERGELLAQINASLAQVEREDFTEGVTEDGDLAVLIRCIRQLLCCGNYSIQVMDNARLKGRTLHHFVTERDGTGELLRAALKDPIAFATAPADVQEMIAAKKGMDMKNEEDFRNMAAEPVIIYTYMELNADRKWTVYQEVLGMKIEGTEFTYEKDDLPYIFPVYEQYDGENFGRSYVELFIADLEALDGQSQTVQEGTTVAAQHIRLVRPGGSTSKKALQDARTGDTITGDERDIGQVNPPTAAPSFQGSIAIQNEIRQRLSQAFLLAAGQQRQAERVTAEEIRFLAQQLEEQLGGAYAQLLVTLQGPHARLKINAFQRNNRMPNFSRNQVAINILTGAAALTRQAKAQALIRGVATVGQFAAQALAERLNLDTLVSVIEEGEGYSFDGLLLTQEQADANRQQQLAEQTAANVAPEVVRQVGQAAQGQAAAVDPEPTVQ